MSDLLQIERTPAGSGPFDAMISLLREISARGIKHGFFDLQVTCEIGSGGVRQVVVRSGTSHKFNIRKDEIPG